MAGLADFARSYDALMLDPRSGEIYGDSGFFNVGYWLPGTADQKLACDNLMERLLADVPNETADVLDAGCGLGASTRAVRRRLPHALVTGINISQRQLERCRRAAPDCRFALMDAARLGFADGRFDCVISVEAAFHFRTRAAFLAEAWRVLRPGGVLVLSDMLFADPSLIGQGMVPAENAVPDIYAYASLVGRAGYGDIVLVDATRRCWKAFCLARLESIRALRRAGGLARHAFEAQTAYFETLMNRSVACYLLAAARKPGGVSPAAAAEPSPRRG